MNARPDPQELESSATSTIDAHDLDVLSRIAALYDRLDPPPAGLVERVQFGITLDLLHAEVAELQRTSDLVGVRSSDATEATTVTFGTADLTMMITTTVTADRARVDGWVVPGDGFGINLRTAEGVTSTIADSDGRFVFEDVVRGLAQFVMRPPAGSSRTPVVTPLIEL